MDSTPTGDSVETPVSATAESRLLRMLPVVRALAGSVRTLSVVSAASAVILWWILFEPIAWLAGIPGRWVALSTTVLLTLLSPALVTFVSYRVLRGVLELPARLKGAVADTTARTRDVAPAPQRSRSGRIFAFFRAIWAFRVLVLESGGAWGKALAALRLARLASLPFVVLLLAAFVLNFVVVGAAMLALFLALLG